MFVASSMVVVVVVLLLLPKRALAATVIAYFEFVVGSHRDVGLSALLLVAVGNDPGAYFVVAAAAVAYLSDYAPCYGKWEHQELVGSH